MIDKGQEQERRRCVPVLGSRRQEAGFPLQCKSRKNFSVVDGLLQYKGENLFLFVAHPLSKQLPQSCSHLARKASSNSVPWCLQGRTTQRKDRT